MYARFQMTATIHSHLHILGGYVLLVHKRSLHLIKQIVFGVIAVGIVSNYDETSFMNAYC